MGQNYYIQMSKKQNCVELNNLPIIAINGVSSFIGSHLAIHFLKKNYIVFGLISKPFKSYEAIRKKRLSICKKVGVKLKEINLLKKEKIRDFISHTKPDYFIHHAAWVKDANSINFDLQEALSVNVKPLRTLYEELSNSCAKGIIITGTNAEYGNKDIGCDELDICMPTTQYGLSKLCMTLTSYQLFQEYKLPTRIARIFNTYGSRMRINDGRAIPAFMGQVLRGESLTVFGDGNQTRSFCYIDDMTEGIYKLLHSTYTKPMNLGNPEEIALVDFAKEIIDLGGNNNKIVFKPLPVNDPLQRKPDITKAIKILNWKPIFSRKKGLKKTFSYFKKLTQKN